MTVRATVYGHPYLVVRKFLASRSSECSLRGFLAIFPGYDSENTVSEHHIA